MIKQLDHTGSETSQKIHALFQISYAVEADILNVEDFPPLKRTVRNIRESDTAFYAIRKNQDLAALVEIKIEEQSTDIYSLVVHPDCFRQGLGERLLTFILHSFGSNTCTVETGLDNTPAIRLYEKLGFVEVRQWVTSFGIRKIELRKEPMK